MTNDPQVLDGSISPSTPAKPQVRVTVDSTAPKPWGAKCDLCPKDVERFYARHWAVAHAKHHAINCPNAPQEDLS